MATVGKKCQKKQECERRDWDAVSVSARSALTDMGAPGSPPGLGGGDAMRLIHVIRVSLHCVLCMHSYRYSGHQANLCRYTPQSCALQVVVCYESMWIYVCISVFEFVLLLTAGSMRCKVSLVVSCHFGSEPPQPDFFPTHPHLRANGGSGEAGRSIHCVEPAPLLRAGSGGGRGGRSIGLEPAPPLADSERPDSWQL